MNQQRTAILKQVPGKSTPRLNTLTASELVEAIASRQITSESVVRDCLARIEEREEDVQAWAYIDEELVLRQARECDEAEVRGPLHGLPVGIKDIIDTCDMPTGMGSPIYRDHQPEIDAACVSILRAAGAVIMGKTVTAEFAGAAPGATRNPHNLAHTPGGSSSGSAAAVADYMVPVALGTQTGGSVHRPSAFCGTVGFKPTFGTFSRKGIKLAAESLDTIGIHARTVADCELMTAVLAGNLAVGRPEISKTPRIGLCRTFLWDTVEPAQAEAIDRAVDRLSAAGATFVVQELPDNFSRLEKVREKINDHERSQALAYEWQHHRELISEKMQSTIERGLDSPYQDYITALEAAEDCRAQLPGVFNGLDALLVPCVPGEAPKGLAWTGDHRLQGIWTVLQTPAMFLPTGTGPNKLPVGIMLVGQRRGDNKLFAIARWVENALRV